MPDQATVNAAVLDQLERDYDAEMALFMSRLEGLTDGLKLIRGAIVGRENNNGEGPDFITFMVEAEPTPEALAPYAMIAGGNNARN